VPAARRPSGRRGFSIVEALFASAILALAIVAMFGLWAGMFRRLSQARYAAQAGQLARAEIERAKVYGMDNLPMGAYSATTGSATWTGAYSPASNGWAAGASSYFDQNGNRLAGATGAALQMQAQIVDSDVLPKSGGYAFGLESRRALVVRVNDAATGGEVMRMATVIAPGGL
jgi:type II secretory pathway pseudopilin PulG